MEFEKFAMNLQELEKELEAVKERNAKVEADKAWETSKFRMLCLMLIIFVVAWAILYIAGIDKPLQNALVPPFAYAVSMQVVPILKKFWLRKFWRK